VGGDPAEIAARVRAAEAYAGFDHAALEKASGIGRATLQRMGSAGNSRTPDLEERQKIADACGVPRRFMEEGFVALRDDATGDYVTHDELDEKLAALEGLIIDRTRRDDALEDEQVDVGQ
jgi:hypothetical protein